MELSESQDKEPIQTKQTVVEIGESQDQASDSEEDTQFGFVWEKIKEVETLKDKHVTVQNKTRTGYVSPPQLQMMSEREAQEVALFGEVLIWSPDRIVPDLEEGVEENKAVTDKPRIDNPFANIVIPETEEQCKDKP